MLIIYMRLSIVYNFLLHNKSNALKTFVMVFSVNFSNYGCCLLINKVIVMKTLVLSCSLPLYLQTSLLYLFVILASLDTYSTWKL